MTYRLFTKVPVDQTRRELHQTFAQWPGAELIRIYEPKRRAAGALVVFDFNGQRIRVDYAGQEDYASNLRAIYLSLDGIRLSYTRGLGDVLLHTVSQMLALPGAQHIDPYELLGVRPDAPIEDIEDMYKIRAKRAHPDKGGSAEQMTQLNAAIERIRADRAGAS